ncbi:hypothetical protein [uncultured Phascolarctobacterium sp.]|uniref:hypothetical protein n=1 Tax=uncultured Phascolarctobacterium sp. TaxID=512296 RepID=UPI00262B9A65|nr:hypothetical protein [uncultured Phascolarctobacterium sp.]
MNFKNAVIGILAAVMMSSFVNLAQAASFTIRAQEGPFALQEELGYDENHQNYKAFIWLKRSLAEKAVAEYVTPYFQKKGIVLSSEQADAVAFGAMEISDLRVVLRLEGVMAAATGTIVDESKMDEILANQKYIDGYILTMRSIYQLDRELAEPEMKYMGNPNPENAREVRKVTSRYLHPFFKLHCMHVYWQEQDFTVTVTQDDAKITETPNNENPDCLVTTVTKGELLHTMTPRSDGYSNGYVNVITADGEQGYISSTAVKWNF